MQGFRNASASGASWHSSGHPGGNPPSMADSLCEDSSGGGCDGVRNVCSLSLCDEPQTPFCKVSGTLHRQAGVACHPILKPVQGRVERVEDQADCDRRAQVQHLRSELRRRKEEHALLEKQAAQQSSWTEVILNRLRASAFDRSFHKPLRPASQSPRFSSSRSQTEASDGGRAPLAALRPAMNTPFNSKCAPHRAAGKLEPWPVFAPDRVTCPRLDFTGQFRDASEQRRRATTASRDRSDSFCTRVSTPTLQGAPSIPIREGGPDCFRDPIPPSSSMHARRGASEHEAKIFPLNDAFGADSPFWSALKEAVRDGPAANAARGGVYCRVECGGEELVVNQSFFESFVAVWKSLRGDVPSLAVSACQSDHRHHDTEETSRRRSRTLADAGASRAGLLTGPAQKRRSVSAASKFGGEGGHQGGLQMGGGSHRIGGDSRPTGGEGSHQFGGSHQLAGEDSHHMGGGGHQFRGGSHQRGCEGSHQIGGGGCALTRTPVPSAAGSGRVSLNSNSTVSFPGAAAAAAEEEGPPQAPRGAGRRRGSALSCEGSAERCISQIREVRPAQQWAVSSHKPLHQLQQALGRPFDAGGDEVSVLRANASACPANASDASLEDRLRHLEVALQAPPRRGAAPEPASIEERIAAIEQTIHDDRASQRSTSAGPSTAASVRVRDAGEFRESELDVVLSRIHVLEAALEQTRYDHHREISKVEARLMTEAGARHEIVQELDRVKQRTRVQLLRMRGELRSEKQAHQQLREAAPPPARALQQAAETAVAAKRKEHEAAMKCREARLRNEFSTAAAEPPLKPSKKPDPPPPGTPPPEQRKPARGSPPLAIPLEELAVSNPIASPVLAHHASCVPEMPPLRSLSEPPGDVSHPSHLSHPAAPEQKGPTTPTAQKPPLPRLATPGAGAGRRDAAPCAQPPLPFNSDATVEGAGSEPGPAESPAWRDGAPPQPPPPGDPQQALCAVLSTFSAGDGAPGAHDLPPFLVERFLTLSQTLLSNQSLPQDEETLALIDKVKNLEAKLLNSGALAVPQAPRSSPFPLPTPYFAGEEDGGPGAASAQPASRHHAPTHLPATPRGTAQLLEPCSNPASISPNDPAHLPQPYAASAPQTPSALRPALPPLAVDPNQPAQGHQPQRHHVSSGFQYPTPPQTPSALRPALPPLGGDPNQPAQGYHHPQRHHVSSGFQYPTPPGSGYASSAARNTLGDQASLGAGGDPLRPGSDSDLNTAELDDEILHAAGTPAGGASCCHGTPAGSQAPASPPTDALDISEITELLSPAAHHDRRAPVDLSMGGDATELSPAAHHDRRTPVDLSMGDDATELRLEKLAAQVRAMLQQGCDEQPGSAPGALSPGDSRRCRKPLASCVEGGGGGLPKSPLGTVGPSVEAAAFHPRPSDAQLQHRGRSRSLRGDGPAAKPAPLPPVTTAAGLNDESRTSSNSTTRSRRKFW
ncbi:hypothetical protein DIPPA_01511 [Diplonema papillatum]|nr:hypothetical protein DIPPA_01511 [Diplonema papillatum]